ncbi:DUF305 domain-containing protein [Mycolicibacterium litorale]|uniref:DUF305 domain-containing protein n=1 Tax=Mycolicibacterium litorale TaxID=758802 RepID=A0AAD1IJS7_9MYCO|nr:DUF305 domain-containing protein [Mycolicibacterium litorale]MCV7415788.1 DUF305 domain-containing protein [Mycolicibacterium litorale]TDY09038.1 uncharacterized protein (DUF305 family) [Mycolicibacterium litorale]BBY16975.1 DUF305 domain-containing protein [Mycolicibacterium litorale]
MQHKRYGVGVAVLAASTLLVGACSNSGTDSEPAASPTTAASSASPGPASSDATHNDADVMFTQGMIPHHQQAIEMSDMLLGKQGIDPEVISLANEIKNAQGPEIEQMQGWLEQWGVSDTPTPSGTGMPGHQMPGGGDMGDMPGHQMPGDGGMGDMPGMGEGGHGMMSETDMAALQNAQGAEASRLFLTQMIEHHKGAITMARQEIDNGQFPAAVDMARNIVSSQQAEIDRMQAMLDK